MINERVRFPDGLADAYAAYEIALQANDADQLSSFFVPDLGTVRYGLADVQRGHAEIVAHHTSQEVRNRRFTSHDLACLVPLAGVAILTTTFTRLADQKTGRQTQVWVRGLTGAWLIAHAHISLAPIDHSP